MGRTCCWLSRRQVEKEPQEASGATIMVMDAEMSSLDDIIEVYQRDVDITLIDECLRRTVEERIRGLEEFDQFREELQAATKKALEQRDAVR